MRKCKPSNARRRNVSVRMNERELSALRQVAKHYAIDRSDAVRQLIRDELARIR